MSEIKNLRSWKKVLEPDLTYIVNEIKELLSCPCVLIITGKVGVGKTTFCRTFPADGDLSSPTYTIYSDTPTVGHADFYRIENNEEIIHLELPSVLYGKDYFLVEWGEKYLGMLDRELGDHFQFFQLVLEENEDKNQSRNYHLKAYERI